MKKSSVLLAVWVLVVGGLVFLAVHVLLQDPDRPNRGASENGSDAPPVDVLPKDGDRIRPPRGGNDTTRPPRPAAMIQGRVLGPEGEAVSGAKVSVVLPTEAPPPPETARTEDIRFINSVIYIDPEDFDRPRPLHEWSAGAMNSGASVPRGIEVANTTSDDEGNFKIDLKRSFGLGPFRLTAEKEGVGRSSAQGVRSGATIELTLGVASKIKGLVLGGASGAAVPSASVALYDGETRFTTTTGADGRFELEGVGTGIYEVTITAKDHPPLLRQQIEIERNADVQLRMPRGATVRVTAILEPLDEEERPLPGVRVVVMEETTLAYVVAETDLNGVAEFHGLPPGDYIVNGRGASAISFGEEQAIIDEGELLAEVDLILEPAVMTPVMVSDEAGNPVAGVKFYAGSQDEEYDALRSEELPGASGTDGKYEFPFEFEGPRATIFGFKKGFAMIRVYPLDHDTGAPFLVTAYKALRVFGRVTTVGGKPVPDAIVSIEIVPDTGDEIDDILIQVRSNKDGQYDFPYVAKGDVWVFAETDDGWSEEFQLEYEDGKTDYKIDLELELD